PAQCLAAKLSVQYFAGRFEEWVDELYFHGRPPLELIDQAQVFEEALDLLGRRAQGTCGVRLPARLRTCAAPADCAYPMGRGVREIDHRRQRVGRQLVLMVKGDRVDNGLG